MVTVLRAMDRSKDISSKPAPRRRTGAILFWLYAPLFAWSLAASGWALVHLPFTRVFLLVFLGFVVLPFPFGRRPGVVTFMTGIAGAHALGAFALHTWLRLPPWAAAAFLLVSLALLVAHGVRAMNAARGARHTYGR